MSGAWDQFAVPSTAPPTSAPQSDPWAAYAIPSEPGPAPDKSVDDYLPIFKQLEGSGVGATSPVGARGTYQIMPKTAVQYGYDPNKLYDPEYNTQAARTIIGDLAHRFNNDVEAMAVAYNAGPGRAHRWIKSGRDNSTLPKETQKYLAHLSRIQSQPADPWSQYAVGATNVPGFAGGGATDWDKYAVPDAAPPPTTDDSDWDKFAVPTSTSTHVGNTAVSYSKPQEKDPGYAAQIIPALTETVTGGIPFLEGLANPVTGLEQGYNTIAPILKTPQIPDQFSPTFTEHDLNKAAGVVGLNPEDTKAATPGERAFREAITLGTSALLPGGSERTLADIAKGVSVMGASGAAGSYASELAPDAYKPLVNLGVTGLTGLAGGLATGARGEAAPAEERTTGTRPTKAPEGGPAPGSVVGIKNEDGSVDNVTIDKYVTSNGDHHTTFVREDGTPDYMRTDQFLQSVVPARGTDIQSEFGELYPGSKPITQADAEAMMAGRNYGRTPKPIPPDETNYPAGTTTPEVRAAVEEGRAAHPAKTEKETLWNQLKSLGGVQLLNNAGELTQGAGDIVNTFRDTLPKGTLGRLNQIVDPETRVKRTAEAIINSPRWRNIFAKPGEGHPPDDARGLLQGSGAPAENWLADTTTGGDYIGDLHEKLEQVAAGNPVFHPAHTGMAERVSRYNDLQEELDRAGVNSGDPKAVAIKKLQEYRLAQNEGVEINAEPEQALPEHEIEALTMQQPIGWESVPRGTDNELGPQRDLREEVSQHLVETLGDLPDRTPVGMLHSLAKYVLDRGRATGKEALVYYNALTNALEHAVTSDHPSSVQQPRNAKGFLAQGIINPASELVSMHNHPSDGSFSPADIHSLAHGGEKWMGVVGHGGNYYFAKLSDWYRNLLNEKYSQLGWSGGYHYMKQALADQYTDAWEHAWKEIETARDEGRVSMRDSDQMFWHTLMRILEHKGIVDYLSSYEPADARAQEVHHEVVASSDRTLPYNRAQPVRFGDAVARVLGLPEDIAARQTGSAGSEEAAGQGHETPQASALEQPGERRPPPRPTLSEERQAEEDARYGIGHNQGPAADITDDLSNRQTDDGKGINKDTSSMAALMRQKNPIRLGGLQPYYYFPRTLATISKEFAPYYQAMMNRITEGVTRLTEARSTIKSALALKPEELAQLFAAAEYNRRAGIKVVEGQPVRIYNSKFDDLRGLRKGDILELKPNVNAAYHDVQKMFSDYWTGIGEGVAKRYLGPDTFKSLNWDKNNPQGNIMSVLNRMAEVNAPRTRADLARVHNMLETLELQRNQTYLPFSRHGDYRLTVRERPTPETSEGAMGGEAYPLKWTSFHDQPITEAVKDGFSGLMRGRKDWTGEVPDWMKDNPDYLRVKQMYGNPNTHEIKFEPRPAPKNVSDLNPQNLGEFFQIMERGVIRDMIKEGKTKTEATAIYDATYRDAVDTLMNKAIENMRAGFRRRADELPGYSGDFSRATGEYMHHAASHIADMIHRGNIDDSYNAIQSLPMTESGLKKYTTEHRDFVENPQRSILGKAVSGLQKVGFAYTMAGRPSTMAMFEMHTPQMSLPRASMGVGYNKFYQSLPLLGPTWWKTNFSTRFDMKNGFTVDPSRIKGLPPDVKAAVVQADREGVFGENLGSSLDVRPEMATEPVGQQPNPSAGQTMRRGLSVADRIAASTINFIDRANRMSLYIAAFRAAKDPAAARDFATFWTDPNKGSHLFRAQQAGTENLANADSYHVAKANYDNLKAKGAPSADVTAARAAMNAAHEKVSVNPDSIARFLVKEAGGDYGKNNTMPLGRGWLGQAGLFLHGFTTRYLSSQLRMLSQHGPEGRAAVLKILPFIFATVGAEGMPFTQDAENLYDYITKQLTGRDPMSSYYLRGKLADMGFGKVGAEAIMRGPVGELLGIDLTGRIGLGDFISREVGSAGQTGLAAWDVLGSHITGAVKRLRTGQGYGPAGSELLPNDLRDLYRAQHQAQAGIRSAGSKQTLIPAKKVTPGMTAATSLGFRSLEEERAYQARDWYFRMKDNEKIKARSPANPIPSLGQSVWP